MDIMDTDLLLKLDSEDKKKISYFANILLRKSKYEKLKEELNEVRKEEKNGDVLVHDEIWSSLNV